MSTYTPQPTWQHLGRTYANSDHWLSTSDMLRALARDILAHEMTPLEVANIIVGYVGAGGGPEPTSRDRVAVTAALREVGYR